MFSLWNLLPERFRPAPPQPERNRTPVPEHRVREVMEALRDYQNAPLNARDFERYLFWEVIADIEPGVHTAGFEFNVQNPLRPEILWGSK